MADPVHIVAIGEILWDVMGAKEHLGGAPFNFSAHAARLGARVDMISAVATDDRGRRALATGDKLGVSMRLVRSVPDPPTGSVTVTVDAAGQPEYTIHRPAAYDQPLLSAADLGRLSSAPPDWVYFGTLANTAPAALAVTRSLIEAVPSARCLYDVNLRERSYDRELLTELLPMANVLKVNADEVAELQRLFGESPKDPATFARKFAARYGYEGVCVTLGASGSLIHWQGEDVVAPGYTTQTADAVGAGDAFAAAFVHGVSSGWPIRRTADFANRVGALVASRSSAIPSWTAVEAWEL